MKLLQSLLQVSNIEESKLSDSNQQNADLLKAHTSARTLSAKECSLKHINKDKRDGKIYVSDWYDDDETVASYNKGKLKESHEGDGITADQLDVGDTVVVSGGNIEFEGSVGEITDFGVDKKFVVVKLFGNKGTHSFHSSDVTLEGDEDGNEDKEDEEFYVAIYDERKNTGWIGMVSKSDNGKWQESTVKGEPDYRWPGGSYMSYLTPHDVMSWISKDYSYFEVEGPFDTAEEAEEHLSDHGVSLTESASTLKKGDRVKLDVKHWNSSEQKSKGLGSVIGREGKALVVKLDDSTREVLVYPDDIEHVKIVNEADFKVKTSLSALDNLEAFNGGKHFSASKRNVICGYPVDFDEDSTEDEIDFTAVDQGAGTDLMKLLRAAGFSVKRHNDTEFTVTVKKQIKEAKGFTDFDDWKQAVLNSYPAQAKKMRFKGRMEGDKDTISAEVPGEDRSYGVWIQNADKGYVLND